MAALPRVSENPEVDSHYATQVALTAALFAALRRLWPAFDPKNPSVSFPQYRAMVAAVVEKFALASVSLNADYYEAMREQAGVSAPFSMPVIDTLTEQQIEAYLDTALSEIMAGQAADLADLTAEIQAEVEASMQKLVMDAGRNEVIAAIEADTEARAWARVTKPGACAFCLMLATRGAVYKSEKTASVRAHTNCHCTVEPLFGTYYEAPAHVREAKALWNDVTAGLSGRAAMNAFRRAVDAQRRA